MKARTNTRQGRRRFLQIAGVAAAALMLEGLPFASRATAVNCCVAPTASVAGLGVTGERAVGEAETDEGTTVFGGHSMIVDPWGETVLEAGNVQGLFTVDIDLDMVDEVRKRIPVYRDRRPKVYGQEDIMSTLEF